MLERSRLKSREKRWLIRGLHCGIAPRDQKSPATHCVLPGLSIHAI
jgi:hypothetical protein